MFGAWLLPLLSAIAPALGEHTELDEELPTKQEWMQNMGEN